jgi:hypothetical protein
MSESKIAWPVITLMADGVLLMTSYINGAPDWVIFLIFFGWWAWFYVYMRFFYKGSLGNSSSSLEGSITSSPSRGENVSFAGDGVELKRDIAYHLAIPRTKDGQVILHGHGFGYVTKGKIGTTAVPELGICHDYHKAVETVETLNSNIGVTKSMARRMVRRWRG